MQKTKTGSEDNKPKSTNRSSGIRLGEDWAFVDEMVERAAIPLTPREIISIAIKRLEQYVEKNGRLPGIDLRPKSDK